MAAAAVFVVGAISLGALGFAAFGRESPYIGRQQPAATTPTPANLPVTPPPGFDARAKWALPVEESSEFALTPDGGIAMVNEGNLEVRDAATGVLRWLDRVPSSSSGSLHVTSIDGSSVLAFGDATELRYWKLDDEQHTAYSVEVPGEGGVSFSGVSPMAVLPDQTAGYISGGQVKLVDVPVGASAVTSTGDGVVAIDHDGRLWRLTAGGGAPAAPVDLDAPGKGAEVVRASGLQNGMFALVWEHGGRQTAILYTAPNGDELRRRSVSRTYFDGVDGIGPTGAGEDPSIAVSDDSSVLMMGDAVFFPHDDESAHVGAFQVAATGSGHLYGTDENGRVLDVTAEGKRRLSGDASVPKLADDSVAAVVVAEKLEQTLMYVLPPTPDGEETPS